MLQYCRNIFLSSFLKNIISLIFHRTFNLKLMREPESIICKEPKSLSSRPGPGRGRTSDVRKTGCWWSVVGTKVLVQGLPTLHCPQKPSASDLECVSSLGKGSQAHTSAAFLGEDSLSITSTL